MVFRRNSGGIVEVRPAELLKIWLLSSNVFENLIDNHDWNGELENGHPFFAVQVGDLEDGWEWWNVKDHEVKTQ